MWTSYPGFEGQKDLGQKQDKAFQANGDELQHKIGDAHHPDQVKEVVAVQVGSGKYETGGEKQFCNLTDAEYRQRQWCKSFWGWNDGMMEWKKDKGKKLTAQHHKWTAPERNKLNTHHTHTHLFTSMTQKGKFKHDGQAEMAGPDTLSQIKSNSLHYLLCSSSWLNV